MPASPETNPVHAKIAEAIRTNDIVLFLKGTPDFPQCGFSGAVAQMIRSLGVPFHSIDVIGQPEYREEIKTFTDWPTIPQIFIKGRFIGGCDILRDLHEKGDLEKMVSDLVRPPG